MGCWKRWRIKLPRTRRSNESDWATKLRHARSRSQRQTLTLHKSGYSVDRRVGLELQGVSPLGVQHNISALMTQVLCEGQTVIENVVITAENKQDPANLSRIHLYFAVPV